MVCRLSGGLMSRVRALCVVIVVLFSAHDRAEEEAVFGIRVSIYGIHNHHRHHHHRFSDKQVPGPPACKEYLLLPGHKRAVSRAHPPATSVHSAICVDRCGNKGFLEGCGPTAI
mmetsp:Transcript_37495/g.60205  ORF Transcript_37495/g.60205 Transcript_37495/m.60205 type:complete len:114 (-) Transcript_37495:748-1089(-)